MPVSSLNLCDEDFLSPILTRLIDAEENLRSLTPKVIYEKLANELQIDQEIITGTQETKQCVKSLAARIAKRINEQRDLVNGDDASVSPKRSKPKKRDSEKSSKSGSPSCAGEEDDSQDCDEVKETKRVKKVTPGTKDSKVKRVERRKEQLRNIVKRMHCGPVLYRNMPKGDDVAYVVELENRIRTKCAELKIPCPPNGLPETSHIIKRMKELELEEELNSIGLKDWEKTDGSESQRRRRRGPTQPAPAQKRRRTAEDPTPSLVNGDETLKSSDVETPPDSADITSSVVDSSDEEIEESMSEEESEYQGSDVSSDEEELPSSD